MRNALIIVLCLLLAQVATAQQLEKVIFRTVTAKTYDAAKQKPKKVDAQEYKSIVIFKGKEVRTNDKGAGSSYTEDLVYEVNTVSSPDKKKQVFAWECEDRIFELNIPKQTVTVRFKRSTYVCIYTGYFI